MKILIIDEKPAFAKVFSKRLTIKGFSVYVQTTLKSGLDVLERNPFDVVFIDIPFEAHSESEVLSFLQKNKVFQKTFVFLFSSIDVKPDQLSEWEKSGLYYYLKKPVKFDVIIKKLDDAKSVLSSTLPEQIPENESHDAQSGDDDEATPEQIEKLTMLQNQIRELEQHAFEPSESYAADNLPNESHDAQSGDDDEATPEQIEKLTMLQNQIRELEQHAFEPSESYAADNLPNESHSFSNESFTEALNVFDSLIANLKSFEPTTEPNDDSDSTEKITTSYIDNEQTDLEKEIETTLQQIRALKNEICILDDAELKKNVATLSGKSKHKIKSTAPKTKHKIKNTKPNKTAKKTRK